MDQRMLRLMILRAGLVALPFAIWFLWRAWARRSGREMGATPWPWLFAAGAFLVGLSLMATAIFHEDNRGERYVPAEVQPNGEVTGGRFEPNAK